MHQFSRSVSPDRQVEVEFSLQVLEEIRQKAVDGLVALRRSGLGIGGLLLGTDQGIGPVRIVAFEEIECSHANGPSFFLTSAELQALRGRLQQKLSFGVCGFYVTRPRGELALTEQQTAMAKELFGGPRHTILVIRPGSLDPSLAALYFWNSGVLEKGQEWDLLPWPGEPRARKNPRPAPFPSEPPSFQEPPMERSPETPAPARFEWKEPEEQQSSGHQELPNEPIIGGVGESAVDSQIHEKSTLTLQPESVASPIAFAPAPISIAFDESAPVIPTATPTEKILRSSERMYLRLRENASRILIYAAMILLVFGVGAGIYMSRSLWITPPPANLTIADSKGILTFRWDPEAAEFVDAGTLSILDGGERTTIALTHDDLRKGKLEYTRTENHVTASLALDERRFLASYTEPERAAVPPSESGKP